MRLTYKNVDFDLADGEDRPLYLVFGVRKSGSSILNSIVAAMAKHASVPYVDVAGSLFRDGIAVDQWQADPAIAGLMRQGNLLAGFRDFPFAFRDAPGWVDARKVLLVRDPRDALVSEYFSNAFSHAVPEQGGAREVMLKLREEARAVDIQAFVLKRAPDMVKTLSQYLLVRDSPGALVLRYEDFIPAKGEHIRAIASHFGWEMPEHLVSQILEWADVRPEVEDPKRFVRKVTPGDHVTKLSLPTIARLDEILGPIMRAYGYAPGMHPAS